MFTVLPSKYAFAAYYVSIWSPSVCLHSIIHILPNTHAHTYMHKLSLSLLHALISSYEEKPAEDQGKENAYDWLLISCTLSTWQHVPLSLSLSLSLSLTHTHTRHTPHTLSLFLLIILMPP